MDKITNNPVFKITVGLIEFIAYILFFILLGFILTSSKPTKDPRLTIEVECTHKAPLERLEAPSRGVSVISDTVDATVYNAVPAQTNSDPGHTATMFELNLDDPESHRIIAVSRDLEKKFPMHSVVRIEGTNRDGIYIVEDRMNRRFRKRIDFLVDNKTKYGKWENVSVTLVKKREVVKLSEYCF